MRNIYTNRRRRTPLLDRLALISALTLVGIVSFDLIAYKWYGGFDSASVTNITSVVASGD